MEKGRVVSKVTRITLGSLDSQTKASTLHHSCLTNYCPTTRGGSGVGVEMKEKTRVGDAGIGPSLNSALQAGGEGGGCNLRDKGSL